jgi:hypothetical protein
MVQPSVTVRSLPSQTRNLIALGFVLTFLVGYVTGGALTWAGWNEALRPLAGALTLTQR